MIAALSQMHLLIAALLMAGCGLFAAGTAALLYWLYERLEAILLGRNVVSKQRIDRRREDPKSSHA